jgi:hypothetical protein
MIGLTVRLIFASRVPTLAAITGATNWTITDHRDYSTRRLEKSRKAAAQ